MAQYDRLDGHPDVLHVERSQPDTAGHGYPDLPLSGTPVCSAHGVAGRDRYALFPDRRLSPRPDRVRHPDALSLELAPQNVQRFFINEAGGIALDRSPVVPDDRALVGDVRHFIVRYGVGVIIVDRKTRNAVTVEALIRRTLEMPPVVDGGTDAWYQVQKAPGIIGSDHPEPATG